MATKAVVPTSFTLDAWEGLWTKNYIPFHLKDVHKDLLKHEKELLPKPSKVFVPLCGKSVDMKYLADKGHTVVGVEISNLAIEQFFNEYNIEYEKNDHKIAKFCEYKSLDSKIALYQGNLYDMSPEEFGKFDAIWDRGSFVAINVEDRNKYAKVMAELLKEDGRFLLNVFTYDRTKYGGPPHTVSEKELNELFGSSCTLQLLSKYHTEDVLRKELGLDDFLASNYLLKPKLVSPAL